MTEQIVDAVCRKIAKAFPEYEIYTESIPNGAAPPCFFVRVISGQLERENGGRFRFVCPVVIDFYPEQNGEENSAVYNVADTLFFAVESIETEGKTIRGTISREYPDGALECTAEYEYFFVGDGEAADIMKEIRVKL